MRSVCPALSKEWSPGFHGHAVERGVHVGTCERDPCTGLKLQRSARGPSFEARIFIVSQQAVGEPEAEVIERTRGRNPDMPVAGAGPANATTRDSIPPSRTSITAG